MDVETIIKWKELRLHSILANIQYPKSKNRPFLVNSACECWKYPIL